MTQIRHDFDAMADLLLAAAAQRRDHQAERAGPSTGTPSNGAANDATGAAATSGRSAGGEDLVGDALPEIDRIVLYIDDLDRLSASRQTTAATPTAGRSLVVMSVGQLGDTGDRPLAPVGESR